GPNVSADELSTFVRERMAGFNVPTHVWFRAEPLPRNPQGKVLKRELRDELVAPADWGAALITGSGDRPVSPSRPRSRGAPSGTTTAARNTPMVRHSSAFGAS